MHQIGFILGASRSGTSLLSSALAAQNDICVLPETFWISTAHTLGFSQIRSTFEVNLFLKVLLRTSLGVDASFSRSLEVFRKRNQSYRGSYSDLFRLYCQFLMRGKNKKLVIEKTPAHTTFLQQINYQFPEAYGIIILRDLRDIIASYINSFGVKGEGILTALVGVRVYYYHLIKNPPQKSLFLKYEELTDNPVQEISQIRSFLRLSEDNLSESIVLRPTQRVEGIHQNLGKPISKNSTKYRKLPNDFIRNIEAALRMEMDFAGYMPDFAETPESRAFAQKINEKFLKQLEISIEKNKGCWKRRPYRILRAATRQLLTPTVIHDKEIRYLSY